MRATMDVAGQMHSKILHILDVDGPEPSDTADLLRFLYVESTPPLGVWLAPLLHSGVKDIETLCSMPPPELHEILTQIREDFLASDIAQGHGHPTPLDLSNLWYNMRRYDEEMLRP